MKKLFLFILILSMFAAAAGCSSPPERKIVPRSELEKMPAVEKDSK